MTGAATLNGAAFGASAALAPGDAVVTGSDGDATLSFGQTQARAAAATAFRLEGTNTQPTLRLDYGHMQLTGALPVALGVYSLSATPAADYTVAWNGEAATVSVNSGTVSIKGGGRKNAVTAGHTATWDTPPAKAGSDDSRTWKILLVATAISLVAGIWVHEATRCSHCVSY